ncbi:MAG: acyl carrier protein [Opitutales bacterium]|nr:acyl carrier protein [Opitutales bacterium]
MNRQELQRQVKELIISALDLEDMTPDDIETSQPLFKEGLGLDSIDALELGMAIKKKFGVDFNEGEDNTKIFASVEAISDYIAKNLPDKN